MKSDAMNIMAILLQYTGILILFRGVLGFPFRKGKIAVVACIPILVRICFQKQIHGLPFISLKILSLEIMPEDPLYFLLICLFVLCLFQSLKITEVLLILTAHGRITDLIMALVRWEDYYRDSQAVFSAAILIIVFLFFTLLISKKRKQIPETLNSIPAWLYLLAWFILDLAGRSYQALGTSLTNQLRVQVFNRVLAAGTDVVIILLFTVIAVLLYGQKQIKKRDQMNQRLLKIQAEQWRLQNESQKELRAFRHDFLAHMQALDTLSKRKDYEKLDSYIRKLGEIRESVLYISTNHIIGDAILNEYYRRGKEDGTIVNVIGRFPDEMKITDMDFCILLSNLMSNAWKAAQKVNGRRQIQVKIGSYNENVFLSVRNTTRSTPVIVDDMILSTERIKDGHGFGIENMKKALSPYGGTIRWETDDEGTNGIFVTTKVFF